MQTMQFVISIFHKYNDWNKPIENSRYSASVSFLIHTQCKPGIKVSELKIVVDLAL